ncbi:hypothetical protein ACOJQI_02595 [Bacillus salacetis]|uniref:hypothetical protein n=1 Tax=Bacillus salacetis TaxID=2315464 RepID=UPI003BA1D859
MKQPWLACGMILLMTFTSACGTSTESGTENGTESAASPENGTASPETGTDSPESNGSEAPECDTGGAIVDYISFLKINDIMYEEFYREGTSGPYPDFETGEKVGEITFRLAECAPPEYRSQNGDAAYLYAGTAIHEVKGYPSELMVEANGNLYIAHRNENAETVADLYPVEGKVKDLHLQSTGDGSRMNTFSEENKEAFLDELLNQELIDLETLWEGDGLNGDRAFIELELDNGASFRLVYWVDESAFSFGAYGTDRIAEIIQEERERAAEQE